MQVDFKTMCRGDGVVYIEILAKKSASANHIEAEAFSEAHVRLPLEGYSMDAGGCDASIVYVTPLLDTKLICLVLKEVTPDGGVVGECQKTIDRTVLKWISRFNYKVTKGNAYFIRDTEKFTYDRQLHINPVFVLNSNTTPPAFIVKGEVDTPSDETGISLDVIDGQGHPVESMRIEPGPLKGAEIDGNARLVSQFSVRIPDDGTTYCIVARSASGNKEGFLCFSATMRSSLVSSHNPLFYKMSGPGMYRTYREHHEKLAFRAPKLAPGALVASVHGGATQAAFKGGAEPLFSIVVPLYKTPPVFFREMTTSVFAQTYQNWELVLVNASPDDDVLAAELAALDDARIKVVSVSENLGIAGNTNVGIDASTGDYIALFDHDDVLDPLILEEYAKRVIADPTIIALYCDEDFLTEDGTFTAPHFKSDFNIDLLRCHNYITHMLCVKADVLKSLKERPEFDGAQDYDLVLRVAEQGTNIAHVPGVLYHWRIHEGSTAKSAGNKNYADENGRRALQGHLDRVGLAGTAQLTDNACFYHVSYAIEDNPLVSIVIPNKDNPEVLRRCIDSLFALTEYRHFEVIVVENNSTDQATFSYYDKVQKTHPEVKVVVWEDKEGEGFNYSKINNFGVDHSEGAYILLLNNDTEVISSGWLGSMLSLCQRKDVGAVGAKLLYPDDTVQHAGVIMRKGGGPYDVAGPIHVFQHIDRDDPGYMRRAMLRQDLSVVTAACLMTKRSVWDELGGLDETFKVAFNDVDFCLRVRELGLLVVFDPDALLYHYESLSRGSDTSASGLANYARFVSEQGHLRMRWPVYYAQGDPYHTEFSTKAV